MDKAIIKKFGGTVLALLSCGVAMATQELTAASSEGTVNPDVSQLTFGSNLFVEPCNTCDFDSNGGGFAVWGSANCSNPVMSEWIGVPFISAATGVPTRILASILLNKPGKCPTTKVTLSIYTDACYPNGPGTLLVSGVAKCPPRNAPCVLATARLTNAPSLTKGTKYWVVATTNDRQNGLDATWYASNNAQIGLNIGVGWFQFSGGTPGFAVQGRGQGESAVARKPSLKMPDVAHPTFGSNLFVDSCNPCNYDSFSNGYAVWGPNNCTFSGQTEWLGVPFIAAFSGVPKRISAPIILHNPTACPTNKVTLSIYTDDCYPLGPGTPLVSGEATVPTALCDLAVAILRNAPSLAKGTKYWVVATTTEAQAALDAVWYPSNDAQFGINVGDGWYQSNDGVPAFMVQ